MKLKHNRVFVLRCKTLTLEERNFSEQKAKFKTEIFKRKETGVKNNGNKNDERS